MQKLRKRLSDKERTGVNFEVPWGCENELITAEVAELMLKYKWDTVKYTPQPNNCRLLVTFSRK